MGFLVASDAMAAAAPCKAQRLRRVRQGSTAMLLSAAVLLGVAASGPRAAFVGVGSPSARNSRCAVRRAFSEQEALQAEPTLELIKEQNIAGHKMKELGYDLQDRLYKASRLDGAVQVTMDGMQRIKSVEFGSSLPEAGELSDAVLAALQEAHDASSAGVEDDVWNLYAQNSALAQAPLAQIGAGATAEDLWANVTKTEESVKLAEELFLRFDKDKDGYWNMNETSEVQMATEGTGMREEDFKSLIIAAAPEGGRNLDEEDLAQGLSKSQVIELYTDKDKQRQLGFVLNIYQDHAKVFAQDAAAEQAAAEQAAAEQAAAEGEQAAAPAAGPPIVD